MIISIKIDSRDIGAFINLSLKFGMCFRYISHSIYM